MNETIHIKSQLTYNHYYYHFSNLKNKIYLPIFFRFIDLDDRFGSIAGRASTLKV